MGAAWEEGGVVRREGSPALACPLSPARTLPGSPGVAATREAQPRIAFLPGRAARARSASSRNRARRVGWRGREGPSWLAAAPSSWDPGTGQGQGPECKDQEGAAGRGREPGSEMGRARMEERGLALHAGGGEGGDPGAGTTEEGRTVETRAGIPGVGPARRRVGRALTSQLARKPVGAGLADGRLEEFAAGCPVWCELVPFSSQRG